MNTNSYKDQIMLMHEDACIQNAAEGVIRRILAYSNDAMCVENTFKKGRLEHCTAIRILRLHMLSLGDFALL